MVVASDQTWSIPDTKGDDPTAGMTSLARFSDNKELEIVEKSIESCYINGFCEKRKRPIKKIFRNAVYQPSLEDIKEDDEAEIAEIEEKFDLTLSALHRERAMNSGCFLEDRSQKYRKKHYKKDREPIERRPRSQTV